MTRTSKTFSKNFYSFLFETTKLEETALKNEERISADKRIFDLKAESQRLKMLQQATGDDSLEDDGPDMGTADRNIWTMTLDSIANPTTTLDPATAAAGGSPEKGDGEKE